MKICKCGKPAKRGKKCYSCISRDWRQNNPIQAAYYNLRSNAKRRNKEFNLTFEQFKQFSIRTEYHRKKGRYSDSYHIDRINDQEGYNINNIQVLTNRDNVLKYKKCKMEKDSRGDKTFFTIAIFEQQQTQDQCPF